jgi:predicted Zn-dependent protease
VLAVQGRNAEAEAELRQILAIQLQVLGTDHPDTHTTLQGIGDALAAQGRAAEAEAEFRQARRSDSGSWVPATRTRSLLAATSAPRFTTKAKPQKPAPNRSDLAQYETDPPEVPL